MILEKLSSLKFNLEAEADFLSDSIKMLMDNMDNKYTINEVFKDVIKLRATLYGIVYILDEIKKDI